MTIILCQLMSFFFHLISLVILKQFDEGVVWHVLSCVNKALALEFNIALLRFVVFVECLLRFDQWSLNFWIEVLHIWKSHPRLRLCLIKIGVCNVGPWNLKTLSVVNFRICIQNLRSQSNVVLSLKLRPKKLFNCLNRSEFNSCIIVLI